MRNVCVIVPYLPENLIDGYGQDRLISIDIDPDWFLSWTLRHWGLIQPPQPDLELYCALFDTLTSHLDVNELSEHEYDCKYARIEEYNDDFVKIADGIYHKLYPFIGDMPNGHPSRNLMGVDFEYHDKSSIGIVFALE